MDRYLYWADFRGVVRGVNTTADTATGRILDVPRACRSGFLVDFPSGVGGVEAAAKMEIG